MNLKALIAGLVTSASVLGTGDAALAESRNLVLVELFTSQGCSSCPPADKLLNKLAKRSDVLPLALHVDYWDYIGWADNFARPEHTQRQKAYAQLAGSRTIYTPQMVINGVEQIVGARPMEVADAVMDHLAQGPAVDLTVAQSGETLHISAPIPEEVRGVMLVQLVRFIPDETVEIRKGENAGRTLDYSNIVTAWDVIEEWSGAAPLAMDVSIAGEDSVAVVIQQREDGSVLAASAVN